MRNDMKMIRIIIKIVLVSFLFFSCEGNLMKNPLRDRKISFWKEISKSANKIEQLFESGENSQGYEEISNIISKYFPEVYFNISYIAQNKKIEISFSPEGDKTKQIITEFIIENDSIPENWKFFAYKQPSNLEGTSIKMFDVDFETDSFYISYQLNKSKEKLNVLVFHPKFVNIDKEKQRHVSIIIIEETLGEALSEIFLESIDSSELFIKKSISIPQFYTEFQLKAKTNSWDLSRKPTEEWVGYTNKDELIVKNKTLIPREDIYIGTTRIFELVNNKIEAYPGTKFIYICMEIGKLPSNEIVNLRQKIEDTITLELKKNSAGDLIGGATGTVNFYSDFIIYDDATASKIIEKVLKNNFPDIKYKILEYK